MKQVSVAVDRSQFDEAMRLKRKGCTNEALVLLRKLHRRAPGDASICGLIGEIHWNAGKLDNAILWFSKATQAAPASELASLGLFHVLWEANKHRRACAEMNRFLAIADSKEYRDIQKGLHEQLARS